jgi:hypothetical protein
MDRNILAKLLDRFGFDVVIAVEDADGNCVVLLRDGLSPSYAVCRIHSAFDVATAPRFSGPAATGTLSAAVTKHGLADLLDWTDRATALARYQSMVDMPVRSRDVSTISG